MDRRSCSIPFSENDELLYDEEIPVMHNDGEEKPMNRDEAREYSSVYDEP